MSISTNDVVDVAAAAVVVIVIYTYVLESLVFFRVSLLCLSLDRCDWPKNDSIGRQQRELLPNDIIEI